MCACALLDITYFYKTMVVATTANDNAVSPKYCYHDENRILLKHQNFYKHYILHSWVSVWCTVITNSMSIVIFMHLCKNCDIADDY